MNSGFVGSAAALVAVVLLTGSASAAPCSNVGLDPCSVSNAFASITLGSDDESRDELLSWEIGGVDQLSEFEWFFGTGATNRDLGQNAAFTFDGAEADDAADTIITRFSSASLGAAVTLEYALGADGRTLEQFLLVENTRTEEDFPGDTTLAFTLFPYLDLNVGGDPLDTATFDLASQSFTQRDADGTSVIRWIAPPDVLAIDGWWLDDSSIDNRLRANNPNATTGLPDAATPFPPSGAGNVAMALQFDVAIPEGDSFGFVFRNEQTTVPLPATVLLLGGGLGALALIGRRGRRAAGATAR